VDEIPGLRTVVPGNSVLPFKKVRVPVGAVPRPVVSTETVRVTGLPEPTVLALACIEVAVAAFVIVKFAGDEALLGSKAISPK
jgi:hypothetical protein